MAPTWRSLVADTITKTSVSGICCYTSIPTMVAAILSAAAFGGSTGKGPGLASRGHEFLRGIQPVFVDVLTTPSHEVPDRLAGPRTRSRQSVELIAIAGTSWRWDLGRGQALLGQNVARAVTPMNCAVLEQRVRVPPREDLSEGVGPGDEE